MRLVWGAVPALAILTALNLPVSVFSAPPSILVLVGGLCVAALLCLTEDPWAGAFALYAALRGLATPDALDFAALVVFGVLLLVAAQRTPAFALPAIRAGVVFVGGIQIAYAVLQATGFQPTWLGRGTMPVGASVHGLLGNGNYLGAWLAISAAFVPMALLPVWAIGIALSGSALAGLAFAAVLVVRYREYWLWMAACGLSTLGLVFWVRGFNLLPWLQRLAVWKHGLILWLTTAPVFGSGWGSWRAAHIVARAPNAPTQWYDAAHNECLQLGYEGGLVALALLGGWLWSHRTALPDAPAAVAVGIESLAMFPFQIASVACLSLLALGLATRREENQDGSAVSHSHERWTAAQGL